MEKFSAILVDDEPLARRRLRRMLAAFPEIDLIGETGSGREAVQMINTLKPRVVFLDIQMPGLSGFEVLQQLTLTGAAFMPVVIFVTAYDEYALQAFEENTIDYLLKPVTEARLRKAIDKLKALTSPTAAAAETQNLERLLAALQQPKPKYLERISSRIGERIIVFDLENVSHFHAEDKYTFVISLGKRYIVNFTLQELEHLLDPDRFMRIHRSTIVNLEHVAELQTEVGGRCHIRLKGEKDFTLSASHSNAAELKKRLGL
ncbi:MAG: response regulator [candidate division KSB1 bacterium]|nr:response regulator [candidate division KSB1 bacterium]MDZ7301911.1 response regulator [candidate division KSB1 bacterium]MDZ7314258.1 response regulator [candidate division KSB1 bacterium]